MNSVYIEITNVCNLHCSFCPCGTGAENKATANKGNSVEKSSIPANRTFMDSKLFDACIAGAQEIGATNVYFHVLGEPTLHPGFAHYVKKLELTPLKLTLTTNGTTSAKRPRLLPNRHRRTPRTLHQFAFVEHRCRRGLAMEQLHARPHPRNVLRRCHSRAFLQPP